MRTIAFRKTRLSLEGGARIAAALMLLLIGYEATKLSLATTLKGDPIRAHQLAPRDAQVSGLLAAMIMAEPSVDGDRRQKARILARDALSRDPSVIPAIVALGLDSDLDGRKLLTRQLFRYSEKLSRRDFSTQMWAIEDSVEGGDIPAALRHYDIALRTSKNASELLFPVLTAALNDPAIRKPLVHTLIHAPMWREFFLDYAASKGTNPRAVADLLTRLHQAHVSISTFAQTAVVGALVNRGFFRDAWAFYAATHSGADRTRSRDRNFQSELTNQTLFDWTVTADPGVTASIQRSEKGAVFSFSVPATLGGEILSQLQILPPGRYAIDQRSVIDVPPSGTLPYWLLRCRGGPEIGRVPLTESSGSKAIVLEVEEGCQLQELVLVVPASDAGNAVSGQVGPIQLRPAT